MTDQQTTISQTAEQTAPRPTPDRRPRGIDWDAVGDQYWRRDDAALVSDSELARRHGVTAAAVRGARIRRGYPAYRRRLSP